MEEEGATSSSRPVKSILKQSSSFDQQEKPPRNKNAKWDEMNIMQTYHPPDKDYGHMKVEEPKTPYNWEYQDDTTDGPSPLDPSLLSDKLASASASRRRSTPSASEDDSDDDSQLSESDQAKKREFKNRRKMHYNEFNAVQRARRLIAEEEEEDDDESEGASHEAVADEV